MSRKLLLFFLTALSSLIVFSQETDSKSVTYFEKFIINGVKPPIDGTAFLKTFYYEIIQKRSEYANKCVEIVLNKDGTKEFKTNWSVDIDTKSTNYQSFQTFTKNEIPKLVFSNPKEYVWGDSISTTTKIDVNVIYKIKYLGEIKVSFDSKNSSITIKSKDVPAEIKTEELLQSLKDKKSGTYKLSYFNVAIALDNCYDGGNFFAKTTFVGYKVYEIGDEYQTY